MPRRLGEFVRREPVRKAKGSGLRAVDDDLDVFHAEDGLRPGEFPAG